MVLPLGMNVRHITVYFYELLSQRVVAAVAYRMVLPLGMNVRHITVYFYELPSQRVVAAVAYRMVLLLGMNVRHITVYSAGPWCMQLHGTCSCSC
jgi:hypothetical protein